MSTNLKLAESPTLPVLSAPTPPKTPLDDMEGELNEKPEHDGDENDSVDSDTPDIVEQEIAAAEDPGVITTRGVHQRLLCLNCANADISFSTAVSLRLHTKVMHPHKDIAKSTIMRDPDTEKHCSNCNKSFEKRRMLLNHRSRCLDWNDKQMPAPPAQPAQQQLATPPIIVQKSAIAPFKKRKSDDSIAMPEASPEVPSKSAKKARPISERGTEINNAMDLLEALQKLSCCSRQDVDKQCGWLLARGLRTVHDFRRLDKPVAEEVYRDAPKHYPLRNALTVIYGEFLC